MIATMVLVMVVMVMMTMMLLVVMKLKEGQELAPGHEAV